MARAARPLDADELEQLALACPPGAGGVVVLPYFDGERTPNLPDATGTLAGLRTDTEPAQLVRAAYEGVVCGLLDALDALADAGVATNAGRVVVVGGGARSARVPTTPRRSAAAAASRSRRPPSTWRAARACKPPPPSPARTSRPSRVRVGTERWTDRRSRSGSRCSTRAHPVPRSAPTHSSRIRRPNVNRTSFNDDWRVRPKVSHFQELLGGGAQPWEAVRLPHDAMIGGRRDPDEHWGNGFFPGGVWQYEKTFVADEELRGKRVLLEFEGVYRGASVWVNGALAGHRPYGYTDFTVSIGEHLRVGEENVDRGARHLAPGLPVVLRCRHLPAGAPDRRRTRTSRARRRSRSRRRRSTTKARWSRWRRPSRTSRS